MWKFLLAGAVLGTSLAVAQAPEPFDHENPQPGWFCVPGKDAADVQTHDHACACRGMVLDPVCPQPVQPPPDDDGTEQPPYTPEPSNCKVHCQPAHCKCRESCKDT